MFRAQSATNSLRDEDYVENARTVQTLHSALLEHPAALEYLRGRGYSDSTIAQFQLGYYPCVGEANNFLIPGVPDWMRGRVMIPLQDTYGGVVSLAGRVIGYPTRDDAKYLHISYPKSNYVYNLHVACGWIRRAGYAYVVEGYTDVFGLFQYGIPNVVAVQGASVALTQLALIARYTNKLIVIQDMDAAGQKAATQIVDLARSKDFLVRALPVWDGYKDVDSFLTEGNRPRVERFIYERRHTRFTAVDPEIQRLRARLRT